MKRYITPGDMILTGVLLLLSLMSLGGMRYMNFSGHHAVVEVNGRRTLELALDRDTETAVKGPLGDTVIVVKKGVVRIASSPCPHGYCMHMGSIRNAGEVLVCVPNRVFVSIRGNGKGKESFDGVSE